MCKEDIQKYVCWGGEGGGGEGGPWKVNKNKQERGVLACA